MIRLSWIQWMLVSLGLICTSNGQSISSKITSFRDARINFLNGLASQIPLQTSPRSAQNYFGTIVASAIGPLPLPYSIDFTLPPNYNLTYDYVIIGAGSAGATVAARLTEDPMVRVLVIEAGGNEDLFSTAPIFAFLQQKTPKDWAYESVPQKHSSFGLKGNRIPVPRGKVVGGGSGINFMLYVRGNRRDYDRWEELGATGWNFSSISPYLIKAEGSRDKKGDPGYHGTTGPLTVIPLQAPFPVDKAFLDGCSQYNLTLGDFNGEIQERWQYSRYTIRDGRRCSTGRAYLGPASQRPNLQVLLFSLVNKILFDRNKVAIGVEFRAIDGSTYQVFVRREVILSAGAINTPQLLMLSGIGPRDQLNRFGIPIIHEAPGVGANLHDHPCTFLFFTTRFGTSFVLPRLSTGLDFIQYSLSASGHFTSPGLDTLGFWRSPFAPDERPDIQISQLSYIVGGAFPDTILAPLFNFDSEVLHKYLIPYTLSDGVMFAITLVRPRSIGSITLASSDPQVAPLIDFNIFNDPRDLDALVEGCKLVLNITQTPAMRAIDTKSFTTPLKNCSVYPLNSDPYLRCLIQTITFTLYHPTSTARMGLSSNPMAVVDSFLRVYGVTNLRVIDASVMPEVTTGNTNVPIITIADRAADLIKGRQLRPRALPIQDTSAIYDYVQAAI